MIKAIKNFITQENGAVTVDWVVLTAAVVGLAGAVILSVQGSSDSLGEATGTYLSDRTPG
ncbi:MAG: hypothetical protein ACJAVM_002509 [Sulfitobacter sp.]|jgi:hypothetical protein